ncbi:MAG: hypothetical protein BYD32DRAFT_428857 [Podila humilis]|nr:MAG: hypothetical protein BYD32DRAFT_428857 [Podila humilis]
MWVLLRWKVNWLVLDVCSERALCSVDPRTHEPIDERDSSSSCLLTTNHNSPTCCA